MQMLTRSGWTPSNDIEVSCSLGGQLLKLVVCKHFVWNILKRCESEYQGPSAFSVVLLSVLKHHTTPVFGPFKELSVAVPL